MSPSLNVRSCEKEMMDDLGSGGPVIDQTLRELEIINRLLGGNYVTINGLKKLAVGKTSLKIIDLGCGGGDMLMLMCNWARKNNITIEVTGIDANPNVIEYARSHTSGFPEISYLVMDIFSEEFTKLQCDIFTSTLFMHHFTGEEIIATISKMKQQATSGFVINDLHRHWFAYHSIRILTQWFSRSAMVRNDAAVSVERAFRKKELKSCLDSANIHRYSISWHWAFRWQVVARL